MKKFKEPVSVIFFSCRRLGLLKQTVDAFVKWNTYPIHELIIVNDSADVNIYNELKVTYPVYTLVLNERNVGLMNSIDLGYVHIRTEYFFHCEDDWMITGPGEFIEKSLAIMTKRPDIEEVWLVDGMNNHPMDEQIYKTNGVEYRIAAENYYKDKIGFIYGWHGFTTACGLKRMSDYRRVAPYTAILSAWKGEQTIWHREHAIGEAYHKLGYRTAALIDHEYAVNIGKGQSEYRTGFEK